MPFVSDAQREYLRRNEPAVYREFKRAEERGDLDLRPPATVAAAARRGLELRAEYGRGGTAVGVARARDLGNRRTLTIETPSGRKIIKLILGGTKHTYRLKEKIKEV